MIEGLFETKKNLWRQLGFMLLALSYNVIPRLAATHPAPTWHDFSYVPCMIGIYFILILFQNRLQISDTQLTVSTWFAGIKKLRTTQQYMLDHFERAEVFHLTNNRYLYLTQKAGKPVVINLNEYTNRDELIAKIAQHVTCDPTPITTDKYGLNDLGKRLGYVVFASAALFVATGIFYFIFAIRLHASHSHFHQAYLIIIPLTMIGLYPYIKKDKKANAVAGAIFSGLFLGPALLFTFYILVQIILG